MKDAITYILLLSLFIAWGVQTVRFNRLDAVRAQYEATQAGIGNGTHTVIHIKGKRVTGIHIETVPEVTE